MDGVFEKAVKDFYEDKSRGPLWINNDYGAADEMPLDVYFRDEDYLNGLEAYALNLCQGRVLDIGAGAGALSLILQERGLTVEALEISETLCTIMADRGVENIISQDFFTFQPKRPYDTLLMMMNGFGICRTLDEISALFKRFDELLAPGGQVLFDSSDVSYVYEEDLPADRYFGELNYQYEYNGEKGPWFNWLYIDIETLANKARQHGYHLQVLSEDMDGQYLGRLTRVG